MKAFVESRFARKNVVIVNEDFRVFVMRNIDAFEQARNKCFSNYIKKINALIEIINDSDMSDDDRMKMKIAFRDMHNSVSEYADCAVLIGEKIGKMVITGEMIQQKQRQQAQQQEQRKELPVPIINKPIIIPTTEIANAPIPTGIDLEGIQSTLDDLPVQLI